MELLTEASHGNVFVNCKFHGTRKDGSELARAPLNNGNGYPYAEAVLINCALDNIVSYGWGKVAHTKNLRYWEFNSTNISDGKSVDISQRKEYSKQLKMPRDKELIENYSSPAFVLKGWNPVAF